MVTTRSQTATKKRLPQEHKLQYERDRAIETRLETNHRNYKIALHGELRPHMAKALFF